MDFDQKEIKNNKDKNYHIENLKIAREFSKELLTETNELTRAIVIFGSNTNNTLNKNSDIDIMVVLDNVSIFVSEELKEAYRIISSKLINNNSNKVHLLTINLSDLWDMARKGDPILINILRSGLALFDRDLITPMQYLLEMGKIRPTREAIYNYMSRAENLIEDVDKRLLDAVLDLYYSLIDMMHSTLMCHKIMPPSPKDMPKLFKKEFENHNEFSLYSIEIENLYELVKKIEYNQTKNISGIEFDELKKKVIIIIKNLKKYNQKILEKNDFEL